MKYRVYVSYIGSFAVDVEAEDIHDAEERAVSIIDGMDSDEFLHELQPQFNECYTEELKGE